MAGRNKLWMGTLVTVGALCLAFVSVQEQLEAYFHTPGWVSLSLIVIGIGLLVFELVVPLFALISDFRNRNTWFGCRTIVEDEIDWMLDYVREIIPDLMPTRNKAIHWFRKNPKAYNIVVKYKSFRASRRESIVGVFVITPVSEAAGELLSKNQLLGSMFEDSHIMKPTEKTSYYYIGSIVSQGYRNKYRTLDAVNGYFQSKFSESNKKIVVYTNPATDDGLRVAKRHGFTPVDTDMKPGQTIYVKEFDC